MPPQKRMECFRLLLENLAWIEHRFLSGIRDSRMAESLWGMMRGMGGVRKSVHQSWLATGLGLLYWSFKGVQEEIPWEETSTLQIGSVAFLPGQFTSPQLHPWHRGCRYEIIKDMKEAVTKVVDTLTQEDFHWAFQKLLERYKCIAAGGDYFEGD